VIPLEPPFDGHGPDGWENSFSILPLIGSVGLLMVVLLIVAALYLWHQRKASLPNRGISGRPEDEAKRILAERFAQGDISADEFLERSSILNWTPGVDPLPSRPSKNRY
jgi:putative membrane protein